MKVILGFGLADMGFHGQEYDTHGDWYIRISLTGQCE